jgi:hypothetical protein
MENVDPAVAIAKMQRRQSAHHVRSSQLAAPTRYQYKSLMESGAVYLKMIAAQSWFSAAYQLFHTHHNR